MFFMAKPPGVTMNQNCSTEPMITAKPNLPIDASFDIILPHDFQMLCACQALERTISSAGFSALNEARIV
jgi:hypothetical protein